MWYTLFISSASQQSVSIISVEWRSNFCHCFVYLASIEEFVEGNFEFLKQAFWIEFFNRNFNFFFRNLNIYSTYTGDFKSYFETSFLANIYAFLNAILNIIFLRLSSNNEFRVFRESHSFLCDFADVHRHMNWDVKNVFKYDEWYCKGNRKACLKD